MPVSHPHRTIFVHIPRTAGSSVEQVFGICGDDNRGGLTPVRPDMLFGLGRFGSKALQHLTASDIRKRVGEDVYRSYFKFAFVRNPYDRIVSIYRRRQDYFSWFTMSFRDFVLNRLPESRRPLRRLLRSRPERVIEDQFDTQYEYVYDENGRCLVDFVGKYENLRSDFKKICDRAGLQAELPVLNNSLHRKSGTFEEYYDEETRKMVGEMYAKDFDVFGYPR